MWGASWAPHFYWPRSPSGLVLGVIRAGDRRAFRVLPGKRIPRSRLEFPAISLLGRLDSREIGP